jgi:hypothetical protein
MRGPTLMSGTGVEAVDVDRVAVEPAAGTTSHPLSVPTQPLSSRDGGSGLRLPPAALHLLNATPTTTPTAHVRGTPPRANILASGFTSLHTMEAATSSTPTIIPRPKVLYVGCEVLIGNVKSRPHLNGTTGTIWSER